MSKHLASDSWRGTCTIPGHDVLLGQLEQLKTLVELNGFELLEGDFTRRDGTRSKFHLKPNDVDRLLQLTKQARDREDDILRAPPPTPT